MCPLRGRYSLSAALPWLGLFLGLALLPLALAAWRAPAPRPLLTEAGAVAGLLGLGLMITQSLSSGRLASIAPEYGADNLAHFHRHIGGIAVVLVLCHPILLVAAEPAFVAYLDPRVNAIRALSLWSLLLALALIALSGFRRETLGLSYEHWRLLHGVLAVVIIVLGTGHALMVDHYLDAPWKKAALTVLAAAAVAVVVLSRLIRPWLARRRPWRVTAVSEERGNAWTVRLEPEGHGGITFLPGQYAWFSFGDTPFTLQQHPFSLAGSADSEQLCITAGAVGDFTAALRDMRPGTRAWVEGPYGSFVPDADVRTSLCLIAGGIGITPFMSMLRTFCARGWQRRVVLICANPTVDDITFADELQAMHSPGVVDVVHVLEDPPEDWSGESGRVDGELVARYAKRQEEPVQYMTCGPGPLMDAVESALRRQGVDWRRIYSERFNIV